VKLKWPFETWFNKSKISGVLHEYAFNGTNCEWLTLGIGINLGSKIPRRELLEFVRTRMKEYLDDVDSILEKYTKRLNIKNKTYKFNIEGKKFIGKVDGIDRLGTLKINENSTNKYCYVGNSYMEEIK